MTQTKQLVGLNSFLYPKFVLSDYHENKVHTSIGSYGEQYIYNALTQDGYFCQKTALERRSGDLRVLDTRTGEWLQIEVKTAFCDYNGQYGFCLRKTNHTSITYSDFVILLLIDKHLTHYKYIIPCGLLQTQFLRITTHPIRYAGKYSPFLVRQNINFDDTREVAELWS